MDIIDNSKKYFVPKYQRDYSWDNTEIGEWDLLWEDIVSQQENHYVGILVLQEYGKDVSIIDGQQRMTTLTIIILAALYIMKEYIDSMSAGQPKNDAEKQLEKLLNKYIGTEGDDLKYYNKLVLNINNKEYFSSMCNIDAHKKLSAIKSPADGLATNRIMQKALKYFYEKIKGHIANADNKKIIDFINKNIADKLIFTVIMVNEGENAYLLFETLNSRSVELTAYDLLKNHLLSKAGVKNEESMLSDLGKIVQNIEGERMASFISLDWNSRNPKISEKRAYREIASKTNDVRSAFKYVAELKTSSEFYKIIKNHEWKEDKETQELLKLLTYIPRIKQYYMVLLSAMRQKSKYPIKKILRALLVIAIRYNYISQGQANRQEAIYNDVANKIFKSKYKDVKAIVADLKRDGLYVSDDEFIAKFISKNFTAEPIDRYILAKIEERISPRTNVDYDRETVEHISDKSLKENFVNRIGNQTLLTANDNKELSKKTYQEKLKFYSKHPRKIVKNINAAKWDEDAVNARSKKLAKIAAEIFTV